MAGGTQQADGDPITEINVTPLVDVCLVLVIIFMAIAPFAMQAGIKVLESKATATVGKVSKSQNVSVRLTRDGILSVNGRQATFETLAESLLGALSKSKDKMVLLTADEENRVGQVVQILDTAKQAGAQKLAILRTERKVAAAEPG